MAYRYRYTALPARFTQLIHLISPPQIMECVHCTLYILRIIYVPFHIRSFSEFIHCQRQSFVWLRPRIHNAVDVSLHLNDTHLYRALTWLCTGTYCTSLALKSAISFTIKIIYDSHLTGASRPVPVSELVSQPVRCYEYISIWFISIWFSCIIIILFRRLIHRERPSEWVSEREICSLIYASHLFTFFHDQLKIIKIFEATASTRVFNWN